MLTQPEPGQEGCQGKGQWGPQAAPAVQRSIPETVDNPIVHTADWKAHRTAADRLVAADTAVVAGIRADCIGTKHTAAVRNLAEDRRIARYPRRPSATAEITEQRA